MPSNDPRIDDYIERSADFARPILEHLRRLIHTACPNVEETIKWGAPHFDHKGSLAGMAAFKGHCAFGFWKHALMSGGRGKLERTAMGSFGRITSIKDLPKDKEIIALIHTAMELNEKGIKIPKKRVPAKEIVMPDVLAAALAKNQKAKAQFDRFSPSHRREYIDWITEAKTAPTRERRLATTIEWLGEGKSRNWKYEKPKTPKEK